MLDNIKPANLWELCELTAEAIETQPLNYQQSHWICDAKKEVSSEACGTAFCRAGWMYALSTSEPKECSRILVEGTGYHEIYIPMRNKLLAAGIPSGVIEALFSASSDTPSDTPWNLRYHRGLEELNAGDPEYARIGAEGMRQFMQDYEKELRGALLAGVEVKQDD